MDKDVEEDFYMDKEEVVANKGRKVKSMKDCTRQEIKEVMEEEELHQGMASQMLNAIIVKNLVTMLPSVTLQKIKWRRKLILLKIKAMLMSPLCF